MKIDHYKPTNNNLAIMMMIGAIFCFSSMDAVAKSLSQEVGTLQTIWARYMTMAILVTVIITPNFKNLVRTNYPKLQAFRSICLMLTTSLFFLSISQIGLAEATALINISPVLITLGAFIFLGEQIGIRRILGISIALFGAIIVVRPGFGVFSIYAIAPLGAALSYSAYGLATRFVGRDENPWTSLFYSALSGAIIFSIFAFPQWQPMSQFAIIQLIVVGILGTTGQWMLIKSLILGEASMLAPFAYTGLVFATSWGILIFNDYPDIWTIIGTVIIVSAGIYVWMRENKG